MMTADSDRLNFLCRAGDVSFGVIHDAPGDGNILLHHDLGPSGEGPTLRDAIDDAMQKEKP